MVTSLTPSRARSMLLALPLSLLFASACGSGSTDTGNNNGSSKFTATIDGAPWAASASSVAAGAVAAGNSFGFAGSQISGANATSLSFSMYNVTAPGSYSLGVGVTGVGGVAIVSNLSSGWSTPLSGSGGTITFSTLNTTRVAGTFSFTAMPLSGNATGNRVVTGGSFDLPLTGTITLGGGGSSVTTTIAGAPFNASSVAATVATGSFILSATTNTYLLTMHLAGVTTAGTYALSANPDRDVAVSAADSFKVWGTASLSTGSVTFTTLSSTRAQGTFTVALPPVVGSLATGTLQLTGVFDVALQ